MSGTYAYNILILNCVTYNQNIVQILWYDGDCDGFCGQIESNTC